MMPTTRRKPKPELTTEATTPVRSWRVELPGFIPVSLNRLMGHWGERARLKAKDARVIATACALAGVPLVGLTKRDRKVRRALKIKGRLAGDPEPVKRHVRVEIRLGKGQRGFDDDNMYKSLMDGLKNAGMLFEDSPKWCSREAGIVWSRGETAEDRGTLLYLEER